MSGGSGHFTCVSRNTSVASVVSTSSGNNGVVRTTAQRVGQALVVCRDARSADIEASASIVVVEPLDLQLHVCPVESELGHTLLVSVKMSGAGAVPINDCSRLAFDVSVRDDAVFRFVSVRSVPLGAASGGDAACALIELSAMRVGRTSVRVQLNDALVSNELHIASYAPLASGHDELVLAYGSSYRVAMRNGPLSHTRPSGAYQFEAHVSRSDLVHVEQQSTTSSTTTTTAGAAATVGHHQHYFRVECKQVASDDDKDSLVSVRLRVAHKRSPLNACPLGFEHEVSVRCARPHAVRLSQLFVVNKERDEDEDEDDEDESLKSMRTNQTSSAHRHEHTCGIKASANTIAVHHERPFHVEMRVSDGDGRLFHNFSSLRIDWKVEDATDAGFVAHLAKSGHQHAHLKTLRTFQSDDYNSANAPNSKLVWLVGDDVDIEANSQFTAAQYVHKNKHSFFTIVTSFGKNNHLMSFEG